MANGKAVRWRCGLIWCSLGALAFACGGDDVTLVGQGGSGGSGGSRTGGAPNGTAGSQFVTPGGEGGTSSVTAPLGGAGADGGSGQGRAGSGGAGCGLEEECGGCDVGEYVVKCAGGEYLAEAAESPSAACELVRERLADGAGGAGAGGASDAKTTPIDRGICDRFEPEGTKILECVGCTVTSHESKAGECNLDGVCCVVLSRFGCAP